MTGVAWSVHEVGPEGLALGGRRRVDDLLFQDRDGGAWMLLGPPTLRRWHGPVMGEETPAHDFEVDVDSDRLRAPAGSEVTVLELGPAEVEAARQDRSEPLTVLGSFDPLAGPATLAGFIVGGQVLDTNRFAGRRCPSEQTAFSLYRIARHRGGAFWEGIADAVARWVAERLTRGDMPVHDLWERGETHTRFLADGVLTLLAQAERWGGSWVSAARTAHALLDRLTVEGEAGPWVVHDSLELEAGEPELVFNTHAQATSVALAAGRDASALLASAERALRLRPRRGRGDVLAAAALVGDLARARGGRLGELGRRLASRARGASAHDQSQQPYLVLRSGWIERDASARPSPVQYHIVNTYDLAVLVAATGSPSLTRHLRRPLAYARWIAARADLREGVETVVLIPTMLAALGRHRDAERAAAWLGAAGGVVPAVGWPGRTDRLFRDLPEGTP